MILFIQILLLIMTADQPRQVLLFYNENGTDFLQRQTSELKAHEAEMKDRDIVVKSYKATPENKAEFSRWKISEADRFTFILVGRDGGEKHRSHELVSHKLLFGKIDAMPMRRNEVERNK